MDFGGRYILGADREAVWRALNDTAILSQVIPGCERIEWETDARLQIEVSVNLGLMAPKFTGELELSNVVPARSYTLTGRAHGKLLGQAQGAANVVLTDHGEDTLLVFEAEGGASGQLLKLGRPLIGHSVQRVIDGFFKRFADAMDVELTVLETEPSDG